MVGHPMAETLSKKPAVRVVLAPKKPLFERVQDWIFEMDVGGGSGLFRMGMFLLLVLLVILVYTGTQFYGLRDAAAMDYGQLARNLSRNEGYVTRIVRPFQIGYFKERGAAPLNPTTGTQPELFTPPGYPYVLATVFKLVRPNFEIGPGTRSVKADRLLMIVGWGCFLAGLVLLYLLARELFDHRAAVLSCFMYVFCDPLLDAAVSGLELNWLAVLFLVAAYGVVKAEKWEAAGQGAAWTYGALAVSALAVGVGILTRYAFAAVAIPLLVYVAISFPKGRWGRVGLCALLMLLVVAPWGVRNWKVARAPFGLTPYLLFEGTGAGTPSEIKPGQLQRSLTTEGLRMRWTTLTRQAILNAHTVYRGDLKDLGGNFLFAFFLVSLLHRWRREEVYRLRRFVFWAVLFGAVWVCVAGSGPRNFLTVFMPLVIIYGSAFFYVMFERLQLRTRILRAGVVGAFGVLNAIPVVYTVLPPTTTLPYPPVDGGICASVCRLFKADATVASDIPWAVAWYGDRPALWIPAEENDYLRINDTVRYISAVYLTQATFHEVRAVDLLTGKQRFLMRLFQVPPPPNFPLTQIEPVTPDGQQVLLSNRVRN
jgi:hypothetical protein